MKSLQRLLALAVLTLVYARGAAADQPGGALSIQFASGSLTVSGAGSGNRVIAFGIGIASHGSAALLTREVQHGTDDNGDGRVTFTLRRLPQRSVWVAAELETGRYAVGTPTGVTPAEITLSPDQWRGGVEFVEVRRAYLEVLLVRPRVAAWALRTADGGSNDEDGFRDGVLRLSLERMGPVVGEPKGPPFALPKDLFVAVDPQTLDVFVREAR